MLDNTQVIILAGGKGTRMEQELPKVLTTLGNKFLIEYILKSVNECNFKINPLVVVGYKGELVKEKLGDNLVYIEQKEQLGTGHAVLCAKDYFSKDAKNIIILYGDMPNISKQTILKLADMQDRDNAVLSMMTVNVPDFLDFRKCFYAFGRIVRDKNKKIKKIVELRDATDEEKNITELNPSLFCFNKDWLLKNLDNLKNNNSQREYYLTDLIGIAIDEGSNINSLSVDPDECIGVNTLEELKRAEEIVL